VIAIGEHAAAPRLRVATKRLVDVLRRGDREALHAARERRFVLGLDEHVDVLSLQADMDDAQPFAPRRGDRCRADRLVHVAAAQAPDCRADTHHDMQRMVRLEIRARLMPLAGANPARLSSGTSPLAAAAKQRLLDMPLALRHRRHDYDVYHLLVDRQSICVDCAQ